MRGNNVIKFEDFSFGFPEKELYEDINVEIETGDHLVLIGSNGCGKSTFVNLLLHEERY
ncbi:MAG: ATP-binding cassette domain-containing protein, partial [Lachnospiraceae bacterium]|nr:ATP-binding cassette domain-containing protein [Lachnospiraceae bacterium]